MDKHNDVIMVYTIFDKYICFAREIPYSVAYTLTQERVAKLTALQEPRELTLYWGRAGAHLPTEPRLTASGRKETTMDQQLEKVSADVLTGIVDRNDATDFLARTGLMVRIAQAAIEYRRCEKALSAVVFEPTIEVAYCQAVMAARAALYRLLDEEERIRAAAALDNAGDTTKGRV